MNPQDVPPAPVVPAPAIGRESLPQRLLRPLIWSVAITLLVVGLSVVASDADAVRDTIVRFGPLEWSVVLGLSLVNYLARFARWEVYLHCLASRIGWRRSLAYYIGGFAFTTTPGKAGEMVRSVYLKRHGVGYAQSVAAFFTERLVDLVAMLLLAMLAVVAFPDYRWPVLLATVVLLACLPLVHLQTFHRRLDGLFGRAPSERVRLLGRRLLALLRSSSILLRGAPLYGGLALGLLAWGAEGVAFHVILRALDVETSMAMAVGIYSVSIIAGAVSFVPGGLGGTEAVMIVLLKLLGVDTPTAIAATLVCRLATLWFAVFLGGIALLGIELVDRRVAPAPAVKSD